MHENKFQWDSRMEFNCVQYDEIQLHKSKKYLASLKNGIVQLYLL